MKKILSALRQPYPYYNYTQKLPKIALIIFLFVFLFLFLFSPFSVNDTEHKYSYAVICLIHALNAAIVFFVFFFSLNVFLKPDLKEENWKVYKTLLTVSIALLLIGLGSFLIRPIIYDNPLNFSWHYFVKETINTFLVGSLVFAAFTLYDFYRLVKNNQVGASTFSEEIEKHKTTVEEEQLISIVIENLPYKLNLTEFLFAKAEGNYVEFYFLKENRIVKDLKRASLKSIDEQLMLLAPAVIKTHRAFCVNTDHISKITGNAQGYQLYFEHIDFAIPVSRALIPAFKKVMKG